MSREEVARLLYQSINGDGHARDWSRANPHARVVFLRTADEVLRRVFVQ